MCEERMSAEAKTFIQQRLKVFRPTMIPKVDVNYLRRADDAASDEILKKVAFEKLEIQQFKVKNKTDGFEIPVTAFLPKDMRQNTSITVFIHGGGWTLGFLNFFVMLYDFDSILFNNKNKYMLLKVQLNVTTTAWLL